MPGTPGTRISLGAPPPQPPHLPSHVFPAPLTSSRSPSSQKALFLCVLLTTTWIGFIMYVGTSALGHSLSAQEYMAGTQKLGMDVKTAGHVLVGGKH